MKKNNKTFFISTPIYYPSGKPHIGHAYSTLLCELIAEYKKLIGYDVFFLTGTDEHGQKLELSAQANNMKPQEYVDKMVIVFEKLWKNLGIKYDWFVRTTDKYHIETVQKVFSILIKKGFIELGTWKGLYCVSCEENYTKTNAIKKEDNNLYCVQEHILKEKFEESYFLKVSLFHKWIKDFLTKNKDFIYPENRAKELINNFLEDGEFENLSISRSTFTWGIPIKENPKHIIYVWIDALLNYISALGYLQKDDSKYKKFWDNPSGQRVHVMSKEITRFHCIYWPIILKMLNLPLPTKIISHGWIITKTGKMSKSKGNVLDPNYFIETYGRDVFRYFLAKEISLKEDSTFSEELLVSINNSDLANNYGNLINRTIGLLKKYSDNIVPKHNNELANKHFKNIIEYANNFVTNANKLIENCQVSDLLFLVVDFESQINLFIENSKPWNLAKESKINVLNCFLSVLTNLVKIMIFYMQPVLIDGSAKAISQLNLNENILDINKILDYSNLDNHKVNSAEIIYSRIEKK
ncbi:MAG: methionine--tRNA ligase [Mycoplasma sp.]|nr:methionine--tRNA ligase [Mycoplasma sp.]